MSQAVVTLVAPRPVVAWRIDVRDAPRTVDATEGPVPFARPRAETPVAWVAGLAFGVLCIAAALVFVVAYAVVALARAVGRPVRRWIREVRQPSVGPATR